MNLISLSYPKSFAEHPLPKRFPNVALVNYTYAACATFMQEPLKNYAGVGGIGRIQEDRWLCDHTLPPLPPLVILEKSKLHPRPIFIEARESGGLRAVRCNLSVHLSPRKNGEDLTSLERIDEHPFPRFPPAVVVEISKVVHDPLRTMQVYTRRLSG